MPRVAFKMKLYPGKEKEYQQRHDALWPELAELLKSTGVSEYSIFLEPVSLELFGVLTITDPARLETLPEHPVMKKWWSYMRDLMETNEDHSPISIPMKEVFYLP